MKAEEFQHDTACDISSNDSVSCRLFSDSFDGDKLSRREVAQTDSKENTGITSEMLTEASTGKLSQETKDLLGAHFSGRDIYSDIAKFNADLSALGSDYRMVTSDSATTGTVNKRILADNKAVALVKTGENPKVLLTDLLQNGSNSQYADRGVVVQREVHIPKLSRLGRPVTDLHEFLRTFND